MASTDTVNILLVDDQPAKLLAYEVVLGELGETLIKASSAREALDALLRVDIAVLLIDVNMPDLDGFGLAAMIREHPRFEHIPIIFVSAVHLTELDRLKGYAAGAVDYVPVPVVPEVLRAKVRIFVELHRKTRQLERLNQELEARVAERTAALEASAAELKRLNEELELRVEERTREREQAMAQLFEAQKLDTLGQLTGGIAHDFNNLLMAVLGNLQILRKRVLDDERRLRLVDNAIQGAERGASLTQRLLAFARRQELKPIVVDVAMLAHGITDLLRRAIGPSIALEIVIPQDVAAVHVDPNQLELALLNLVVNARDAMPSGGTISISAEEIATAPPQASQLGISPGDYVKISVADSGEGMDEETLQKATEPFFTTKGPGKGTGLGLSMVHGLAEQSRGKLRIRSRRGEGTVVEILLPQASDEAAPVATAPDAAAPDVAALGSQTILVVDDDALVGAGTAAMLEDLGHRVLEARSGLDALELLRRHDAIAVVVTDYVMPGMSGLELVRHIHRDFPDKRVILMTGFADLAQQSIEQRGMMRLNKPFTQAQLSDAVVASTPLAAGAASLMLSVTAANQASSSS